MIDSGQRLRYAHYVLARVKSLSALWLMAGILKNLPCRGFFNFNFRIHNTEKMLGTIALLPNNNDNDSRLVFFTDSPETNSVTLITENFCLSIS